MVTEEFREKAERQYNRFAKPVERKFEIAMNNHYKRTAKKLAEAYSKLNAKAEVSKEEAEKQANKIVESLINWNEVEKDNLKILLPIWIQAGIIGNDLANLKIGLSSKEGLIFDIIREDYLKHLDKYGANQVKEITKSYKKFIKRTVRNGIMEGLSENEMSELIISDTESIGKSRAKTIARTETHNTFMQAREQNFVKNGFEYWMWITSKDERVRRMNPDDEFNHVQNDRVVVKIGDLFPSGITRPGDPMGAAGNVINCRCDIIPATREEYIEYLKRAA